MNKAGFGAMLILLCLVIDFSQGRIAMSCAEAVAMPDINDVVLAPNSIGIPLGRILLIRRGNEYGAVKFLQCWTGKETAHDQHAEYESYYQGDQTGNLRSETVQYRKEEVYYTKPGFAIFGHPIRIGAKRNIRCGPIELWWSGLSCRIAIYFNRHDQEQGDYYGIELAPTPWTDISQVNVSDPRVKWYRYDDKRRDYFIPIDELWPAAEAPAQPGPTKP
jgi:hypothetical protein